MGEKSEEEESEKTQKEDEVFSSFEDYEEESEKERVRDVLAALVAVIKNTGVVEEKEGSSETPAPVGVLLGSKRKGKEEEEEFDTEMRDAFSTLSVLGEKRKSDPSGAEGSREDGRAAKRQTPLLLPDTKDELAERLRNLPEELLDKIFFEFLKAKDTNALWWVMDSPEFVDVLVQMEKRIMDKDSKAIDSFQFGSAPESQFQDEDALRNYISKRWAVYFLKNPPSLESGEGALDPIGEGLTTLERVVEGMEGLKMYSILEDVDSSAPKYARRMKAKQISIPLLLTLTKHVFENRFNPTVVDLGTRAYAGLIKNANIDLVDVNNFILETILSMDRNTTGLSDALVSKYLEELDKFLNSISVSKTSIAESSFNQISSSASQFGKLDFLRSLLSSVSSRKGRGSEKLGDLRNVLLGVRSLSFLPPRSLPIMVRYSALPQNFLPLLVESDKLEDEKSMSDVVGAMALYRPERTKELVRKEIDKLELGVADTVFSKIGSNIQVAYLLNSLLDNNLITESDASTVSRQALSQYTTPPLSRKGSALKETLRVLDYLTAVDSRLVKNLVGRYRSGSFSPNIKLNDDISAVVFDGRSQLGGEEVKELLALASERFDSRIVLALLRMYDRIPIPFAKDLAEDVSTRLKEPSGNLPPLTIPELQKRLSTMQAFLLTGSARMITFVKIMNRYKNVLALMNETEDSFRKRVMFYILEKKIPMEDIGDVSSIDPVSYPTSTFLDEETMITDEQNKRRAEKLKKMGLDGESDLFSLFSFDTTSSGSSGSSSSGSSASSSSSTDHMDVSAYIGCAQCSSPSTDYEVVLQGKEKKRYCEECASMFF